MLPSDNRYAEPVVKKSNSLKRAVLFAVFIAGLLFIFYYIYSSGVFDWAAARVKTFMPRKDAAAVGVDLDASKQYKFGTFRDMAVICDRDCVRGIDKNGQEKWKFNLDFSSPAMDISDKDILVADKGGKTIRLFDNYGQKAEITAEDQVLGVTLSDSCITAIIKQKGYKGAVMVYDLKGELLFRWLSGNANIIYADVAPDGRHLAVSVVDTSAGKLTGGVMMFDIKADSKPYAGLTYPDCLISAVQWSDNNLLVMAGDKFLVAADGQGREKWRYDYGGRTLNAFDIKSPKGYALAFGSFDAAGDWDIEIVDGNGKKSGGCKASGEVVSLCTAGGNVLIAGHRDITVIGKNGVQKAKTPLKYDVRLIKPFASGDRVLAVSGVRVEFLDIF